MIQGNRVTDYLSELEFTAICDYYNDDRPMGMYRLGQPWLFHAGDPHADERAHSNIHFYVDLTGWEIGPGRHFADPPGPDHLVQLLVFKSNNRNSINLYIDADQFVLGVKRTDNNTTEYFYIAPDRMDTVHRFDVYTKLTKPGTSGGFVKLKLNGVEEARAMNRPLVQETETGQACYWLLGLDCRRAPPPEGVGYRAATFRLIEQT